MESLKADVNPAEINPKAVPMRNFGYICLTSGELMPKAIDV